MPLTLTLPPTPKQAPDLAGLYRSICVWTRQAQLSITQLADTASKGTTAIANSTTTGLLSSADWNTFNSKLTDAPADGNTYGRKNNTWVTTVISTGNLAENTSAVLTITGGTGAVVGTGTTIQVKKATTSQDGYLSATDWTTFNGKLSDAPSDGNSYARKNAAWVAVSVTSANLTEATSSVLTITGGTNAVLGSGTTIQVKASSGSQSGYLSSTDWTTFNGKLSDAPSNANIYGRQGGAWVIVTVTSFGNLTEATSSVLTITGGTGAVAGTGTSVQVKVATTSQSGYLTSTDWNTFNNKQPAGSYLTDAPSDGTVYGRKNGTWVNTLVTSGNLTEATSSVLTITGGTGSVLGSGTTIQVKVASGSQNGYLSSTDWTTFNSKQGALTFGNLTEATSSILTITGGTGSVIGSGTTVQVKQASGSQSGFLSSTDWTTFNNKLTDAPSDGTVYGRKNGAWVNTLVTTGNLTEATSSVLTITGGTGAVVGSGSTIQVKQATTSQNGYLTSTDWNTFNAKAKATNEIISIALCSAYTPPLLGADFAEVTIPFNSAAGSITFNVTAIRLRVQTAGGSEAVTLEVSTASTGFSPATIGSVSLGAGAYEASVTSSLGTVASGNKVRFNVTNLGTALNWTVIIEMNPT